MKSEKADSVFATEGEKLALLERALAAESELKRVKELHLQKFGQVLAANRRLAEVEDHCRRVEAANHVAAFDRDDMRGELARVSDLLHVTGLEAERLRAERDAIRSSTSWRVTWPVRAAGRLWRRLKEPLYVQLIKNSDLFNAAWYATAYRDVRGAGVGLVQHYLRHGAGEGRNPSLLFNTAWYVSQNPDVVAVGYNPLVHYLRFGRKERRQPLPPDSLSAKVPKSSADIAGVPIPRFHGILGKAHHISPSLDSGDSRPIILVLPAIFAVGGVENNTATIMARLSQMFRFVVVTNESHTAETGCLFDLIKDHCTAIFDLAAIAQREQHVDLLAAICRELSPDLVWVCNGSVWYHQNIDALFNIFRSAPVVDQQVYDQDAGWISHLTPEYAARVGRVIAINSRIKEKLGSTIASPDQIDLIYPACNLSRIRPINEGVARTEPKQRRQYTFLGRLSEQKRPLDLVEVARITAERGAPIEFKMVGVGPLAQPCQDRIDALGLTNISIAPFTSDVQSVFDESDALIFVSAFEGLPVAMLESLSAGKPVFATDVGDISKVGAELGGGVCVVEDAIGRPDRIADALIYFDARIASYQAEAFRVAPDVRRRFGAETVAEEYVKCWTKAWIQAAAREST